MLTQVVAGDVTPSELVEMTTEQLAKPSLIAERQQMQQRLLDEV